MYVLYACWLVMRVGGRVRIGAWASASVCVSVGRCEGEWEGGE